MIFRAYRLEEDGSFFEVLSITIEGRKSFSRKVQNFFRTYEKKFFLTVEILSTDFLMDRATEMQIRDLFFLGQVAFLLRSGWCVAVVDTESKSIRSFTACNNHIGEVVTSIMVHIRPLDNDFVLRTFVRRCAIVAMSRKSEEITDDDL